MAPIFGDGVVKTTIITKQKELNEGIALIDDRPELHGADRAVWQHIIFDKPHNRHSNQPRLFGRQDKNLKHLLDASQSWQK